MSLQNEVVRLHTALRLRREEEEARRERAIALASDPQKPVDPLPKDEHAEGCRCPECDPAFNDPSLDEDGKETSDHYWRRQLGEIARRYAWTPDPKRSK